MDLQTDSVTRSVKEPLASVAVNLAGLVTFPCENLRDRLMNAGRLHPGAHELERGLLVRRCTVSI